MTTGNYRVLLAGGPSGPVWEDNFRIVETEMPRVRDGELLVKKFLFFGQPGAWPVPAEGKPLH